MLYLGKKIEEKNNNFSVTNEWYKNAFILMIEMFSLLVQKNNY